jgi:hypothetical protein
MTPDWKTVPLAVLFSSGTVLGLYLIFVQAVQR